MYMESFVREDDETFNLLAMECVLWSNVGLLNPNLISVGRMRARFRVNGKALQGMRVNENVFVVHASHLYNDKIRNVKEVTDLSHMMVLV